MKTWIVDYDIEKDDGSIGEVTIRVFGKDIREALSNAEKELEGKHAYIWNIGIQADEEIEF